MLSILVLVTALIGSAAVTIDDVGGGGPVAHAVVMDVGGGGPLR